jgi:hypothetical protein
MSCNNKFLTNIPIIISNSIISNNSNIKFNYFNKTLIDIPLNVYSYSNSKLIFQLNRNITFNDTKLLWNVDNINDIKITIANIKNYKLVNDYIYNYHLQNYNFKNIYQLSKNKIMVTPFSKNLNSCWFLSNLYK